MTAIFMGTTTVMLGEEAVPPVLISMFGHTETAVRDTTGTTGTATAVWSYTSNGSFQSAHNAPGSDAVPSATDYNGTDWFLAKPSASEGLNYDLMASQTGQTGSNVLAGSLSGVLDTWVNMNGGSTSLELSKTGNNVEQESQRTFSIDIRPAGGGATIDSMTLVMNADLFGP